jgi:hypothetical protein
MVIGNVDEDGHRTPAYRLGEPSLTNGGGNERER